MDFLIKPARLDIPSSIQQIFGRGGPLVVEIGIGAGRFIASLATTFPDWNFAGIELSPESTMRTFRRLKNNNIGNVRLFKGHALFFIQNVVAPRNLYRVYINFPDPWSRLKHQHKRLMQSSFFRLLSTRLIDAGTIYFTTDHEEYFQEAQEQAYLSKCFMTDVSSPPPEALNTKYARKWKTQRRLFYHVRFTKIAEDTHLFIPTIERINMQHAVLEGTLPDIISFEKQIHRIREGYVIIREVCRSLNGEELLFFVHLEESNLVQEIIIEARPNPKGGIWIGLKRFGEPLYTKGVGRAVGLVTSWLEQNGLRVVHRRH